MISDPSFLHSSSNSFCLFRGHGAAGAYPGHLRVKAGDVLDKWPVCRWATITHPVNLLSQNLHGNFYLLDVRTSDPCVGTYKYLQTNFICLPAKVTCEGSTAQLRCGRGRVIFVYGAYYGRRDRRTCSDGRPQSQVENVNCINPAQEVPQRCNGRHFCSIEASNSVFGDPCYGTYKYLEVAYVCICKFFHVSIKSNLKYQNVYNF
uniref:SUEL-type lectin domain-containing protein n=1 Tax=Oryzias latipes TaxID=8090 RepID=A0A3B3H953_ORYLA